MPIYKKPEDKAVETVTIRLTGDERRMLDHLAALDELTLTDFIRRLIARRAEERHILEPPARKERRRPGRPKMKRESVEPLPRTSEMREPPTAASAAPPPAVPVSFTESSVIPEVARVSNGPVATDVRPSAPSPSISGVVLTQSVYLTAQETQPPSVFGDLVIRFRNSFVHRAEGTKRELEETIAFLCGDAAGTPIISPVLPLSDITSEYLTEVRDAIRDTDVRLAKKNLILTYLRMMLHFAVKEPDIDLRINPSRELPPLSIVESDERRRYFVGQTE